MRWGRVLLGGLAAGVVINVSEAILNIPVLGDDWAQVMSGLGKPTEFGGAQIALFNVLGFLTGIALIWLYAAIRPRYGAGPKTALCAGASMWFIGYVLPSISMSAMDLWPMRLTVIALIWGLGETLVAGLVGGWLYRE